MRRISYLIGIGLLLVGALTYGTQTRPDLLALLPSFGGLFIALGGLAIRRNSPQKDLLVSVNTVLAIILVISSTLAIVAPTPSLTRDDEGSLIVNLEVIMLSTIFLGLAIGLRIRKQHAH